MSSPNTDNTVLNRKRSNVWYHYSVLQNNIEKCNVCSDKLSFSGGSTGNLLRHLKTKHPTIPMQKNIQVKYSLY